jgi:hypothetical protein
MTKRRLFPVFLRRAVSVLGFPAVQKLSFGGASRASCRAVRQQIGKSYPFLTGFDFKLLTFDC